MYAIALLRFLGIALHRSGERRAGNPAAHDGEPNAYDPARSRVDLLQKDAGFRQRPRRIDSALEPASRMFALSHGRIGLGGLMRLVVLWAVGGALTYAAMPAVSQANSAAPDRPFTQNDSVAAPSTPANGGDPLPEVPEPEFAPSAPETVDASASLPGQATAQQSSSQAGSSPQPPQTPDEKTQHEKAEEQLRQQEKQRVMGVMAAFNTTQNRDAVPLSSGQKFKLFFKSATDPWPFGLTAVVAGIGQAQNSNPEWGQGMEGYAKRYGAGYGDYFIGNLFGNAILTSLLREDPRYFQKGTGSAMSRFLWAAGSTVWCKRDKGTWGPNYANVAGNLIGAAIGRIYYPDSSRTVGDTITDGLTVTVEGIVGAEVIEFWPDMVRHHRRKQAEKLARTEAAKPQTDPDKTQQDPQKKQPPPPSPK